MEEEEEEEEEGDTSEQRKVERNTSLYQHLVSSWYYSFILTLINNKEKRHYLQIMRNYLRLFMGTRDQTEAGYCSEDSRWTVVVAITTVIIRPYSLLHVAILCV